MSRQEFESVGYANLIVQLVKALQALGLFLNVSPPHGLALLESADRVELVSAPDCGPLTERFMKKACPRTADSGGDGSSVLVAYEQPITRAEISRIQPLIVVMHGARGLVLGQLARRHALG